MAHAAALGTLHSTEDGRYALRFERAVAHPRDLVWRAITDPEHLRAWFPAVVDLAVPAGSALRFDPTPDQISRLGLSADHPIGTGQLLVAEPPRRLEFTWNDEVLSWELTDIGGGACRLVFVHTIGDAAAAAKLAAGWHAGLEVVAAQLDGQPVTWSPWDRGDELAPAYADLAVTAS